jgi:nucleoside-diphosphate-sugar epimerase
MEAVKTNIIGTDNVLTAAIEAGVNRLSVFLRQSAYRLMRWENKSY